MLKQRIITAVILALGLISALQLSALVFTAVVAVIVMIGMWEWAKLCGYTLKLFRFSMALLQGTLVMWLAMWVDIAGAVHQHLISLLLQIDVALWLVLAIAVVSYPRSAPLLQSNPLKLLLGFVILAGAWVAVAQLVTRDNGKLLLLAGIVIIALADIGGFFVGRAFGKHKLAPQVSPAKTWEGLLGGVGLNVVVALIAALWLELAIVNVMVLVIATGLASVFGDLFESLIKRQCGLKDSGRILPGHGGILDRIDGIVAAMPVFTLLHLVLLGG